MHLRSDNFDRHDHTPCRHDLRAECRILLVHGLLHLLGWDHEIGDAEADRMAAAERRLLAELGWQGDGLIGSVGATAEEGGSSTGSLPDGEVSTCRQSRHRRPSPVVPSWCGAHNAPALCGSACLRHVSHLSALLAFDLIHSIWSGTLTYQSRPSAESSVNEGTAKATDGVPARSEPQSSQRPSRAKQRDIRLVALDMDGALPHPDLLWRHEQLRFQSRTPPRMRPKRVQRAVGLADGRCGVHPGTLLDSNSRVLPSSAEALRAALAAGVTVVLATGKARPAAMAALSEVGLTGAVTCAACTVSSAV
jgi:hypothetical protein